MSLTVGSCSRGSSGPRPNTSSRISSITRSFSTRLRGVFFSSTSLATAARISVLLHQAEGSLLLFHQLGYRRADLGPHTLARHGGERFEVDAVEELAVEGEFQFLVLGSVSLAVKQPVHPAGFTVFTGLGDRIHYSRHSY